MKFNRLSAFTLGVIITAASVGAVTYVNAASNATLKACANKTTGVMRYISKGSCKKTEKALSWNQMGPQGVAGVAGTNGQNFHVIDAAGRDLGPTVGLSGSGQVATIIHEGGIWNINSDTNYPTGAFTFYDNLAIYSDNSCTVPLVVVVEKMQPMARGWNGDQINPKFWKLAGDSFLLPSRVVYVKIQTGTAPFTYPCVASTDPSFATYFQDQETQLNARLSAVTEVTPPAYTAPFTIVAK